MARAVISERVLSKKTAAIISENFPGPVPATPLPFKRPFEVVFVGDRSRRSSRKLLGSERTQNTRTFRTSRVRFSRTSDDFKQHEQDMRRNLNNFFLFGNSSRKISELPQRNQGCSIASTQLSTPSNQCAITTQGSASSITPAKTLASVPLPLSIDHSSMFYFDISHSLVNQMQASPSPSAENSQEPVDPDKPSPMQLSFILDKLREELPAFFEQPHTYSIYSPDMVFTNRLVPFAQRLYGRDSYRSFLAFSKATLTLVYSNLKLEVLRIAKDPFEGKVTARWRIAGRPPFRREERIILDGFSEFIVNTEGLIMEHKIDKMIPSKHHNFAKSFIRKRLEALLPNKQPTITQSQSS